MKAFIALRAKLFKTFYMALGCTNLQSTPLNTSWYTLTHFKRKKKPTCFMMEL